ncbi:hypothetical protein BGX30_002715 [Mortierella sp. GBA39]|nr:hypothetical protein BGX30_002715 [Mortierella sp. GBA39]
MNATANKTTSDFLRRQNALRMLDTILSSSSTPSSLSQQQQQPSHPSSSSRRQKQPSPPSSQDTLAAFAPHIADRGYQPDTDDIGSNDDNNSDSHDDLFSASDLSALMIEQDLRRQHAARKLQSHQLKQRQLLMEQHQRIFQDNQQMHSSSTSTSDRTLQSPITSSHIPGQGHNNNHAEEEDQEDDDEDDDDEDEEEDNTQTTPRHPVNTPKREQQHQYDNVRLARYQESDEDTTTNTPALPNSDKKPKARGRPKGTTADTTPSKAGSSNIRSPDKPKRQYKKTILRQQAALLAAQIKDENEARDTEATRRVLAKTGVIKHLRTLKHRLEFAQYKIDKGLQEQPLHMVVELFDDSIEEDYYSDDECTDNQAGDHLPGNPNPSATLLSTPKSQRSSRQSPTVGRTKLSAAPGFAQRDTKAGDIVSNAGSWSALGAADSDATDSESESDQGFPDTPTKPRGRFAIPRSSTDLSTRTPPPRVRQLTGNAVPNQRLTTTATPTPIAQSVIAPQREFGASSSDQSDFEGTDESDSALEQPITALPTPPSSIPITLETLKRQQELQMEEFQKLQQKQLQALMEEQQKTLLQAQSQWPLQQKTPSRAASSPNPTSTPGPKATVASKHRKATTPRAKENHNPFQEATSDQEQRLRQVQVTPISKPSNAKPPLPLGLQQRKPLQTLTRSMTPDRGPAASPRLTPAILSRTVARGTQDTFVTPQRRPTKSPSPALQRQRTVDLASDTESFHRAKSASPFTPRQLEERERQKERIRENQLREQELIRKQRELEHQQRQQTRRKQLLLRLQYQHLQEQVRLQSSESGNQKSRPEPSKPAEQPRTAEGPSRLLFPPAANSMVTPKKKKPLNPVQKAPSTENILASVRSQQGIRSTIIAASSALTSAKTILLGNKRVLSTTEDKENSASSPFSPAARGQSMGGSQGLVANRQLQEKTYKRQRPAASSSPSPVPHPRLAPASSVQWTSLPQSKATTPLQPVSTPARKPLKERSVDPLTPATPSKLSPTSLQTPVSIRASGGAMNQTSKEFLNCFDQWMSDLGSEDVQGQGLPLSDMPVTPTDSTLDSVVSPFIMDQSQHQGSLGDVFSNGGGFFGQDDGTGTEPDESEIDQLLYSDFGDDYGVYGGSNVGVGGGQGNIGTPVSETGLVDPTADFMKADFYDWFPDSFRDQASSTGPLCAATPPTPSEQRLSLLSTDPILSSSPAELSQGLELDLDFDTAAALSWSRQQSRALQSPQQNFSQQLLQQSPLRDRSTLSRAGTPQLDSSGSLLSSAFTEILPPVVDMVVAPPANHYVPMGLGGGQGVIATSAAEDEEDGVHLGKEHDVLAAHQPVDLAFFLQ